MLSSEDQRILDEVGRWKVLWIKDLFRLLEISTRYTVFCRKIRRLERDGWLNGGYFRREGKILWLTSKGEELSTTGATTEENRLHHDLIRTGVLLKLLECGHFTSGSVSEGMETFLQPDGVIHGLRQDDKTPYLLAVEIEFDHRTSPKKMDKLFQYARNSHYNYVLRIYKDEGLFHRYVGNFSNARDKKGQDRIILSWAEKLGRKEYDVKEAVYWYSGEFCSFKYLFGD